MALAALSSIITDTLASVGALTAASIAVPCILGSPVAQSPSCSSDAGMLLWCNIGPGSSRHNLAVSSASADGTQKRISHLTASAATVLSDARQPCRAHSICAILGSQKSLAEGMAREPPTVASIGRPQPRAGLDGYTVYPAAADSSLQLGAVRGTRSRGRSRVPVGFGAYRARKAGGAAGDRQQLACCGRQSGLHGKFEGKPQVFLLFKPHTAQYLRCDHALHLQYALQVRYVSTAYRRRALRCWPLAVQVPPCGLLPAHWRWTLCHRVLQRSAAHGVRQMPALAQQCPCRDSYPSPLAPPQ